MATELFVRWQEASQKDPRSSSIEPKMTSGKEMKNNNENGKEGKEKNRAMGRKMMTMSFPPDIEPKVNQAQYFLVWLDIAAGRHGGQFFGPLRLPLGGGLPRQVRQKRKEKKSKGSLSSSTTELVTRLRNERAVACAQRNNATRSTLA